MSSTAGRVFKKSCLIFWLTFCSVQIKLKRDIEEWELSINEISVCGKL